MIGHVAGRRACESCCWLCGWLYGMCGRVLAVNIIIKRKKRFLVIQLVVDTCGHVLVRGSAKIKVGRVLVAKIVDHIHDQQSPCCEGT